MFLAAGYGSTTIAAIASEAGVAVDTVYTTFGSKRGIIQALMDVRIVGDDEPVPLLEREGPRGAVGEPDRHRRVEMFAAGITSIHERSRRIDDLMLSASGSDPEIAALRADLQQRQRLQGMRVAVATLTGSGHLRSGLDVEAAVDTLWVLAGPDVHRLFREQRGWSPAEYQTWLADAVERLILDDGARQRKVR